MKTSGCLQHMLGGKSIYENLSLIRIYNYIYQKYGGWGGRKKCHHFIHLALHEVTWCMVYTERAEMAAVSCGTNHASAVSTPLRWIFKKRPIKSYSLM